MAPRTTKKFGAPIFEPEIFGKKMYCLEKVCLWHCCKFWSPQWFGVRGIYPLPHSLRLWCYAIKIGKCSENKQIFISKRHELLFHKHLQFSNTIRHGFCTNCQHRLLAEIQVSSCSLCVASMPGPRVFLAWTCFYFANNKTFPTFNKLLF